MWMEKAKQLYTTLVDFIDEIELNYDDEDDEYSVNPGCDADFDRDFLSIIDALKGDLEYYIET